MPVYVYEDEKSGDRRDIEFPIGQAPARLEMFGARMFRRVWTVPNIVTDPAGASKFEDPRHRKAALEENTRVAEMMKKDPSAYPVTIGANDGGKTPAWLQSDLDWKRKNA